MQGPTLRQLEYLVAVAEYGRFNDAADACSVSQPALSKQVRAAEELLGVEIFERARPRVLVTQVGRRIIEQARRVLGEARELNEIAESSRGALRGRIVLGVIPTVAPYVFPPSIDALGKAFPDLEIVIHEAQTEVLVEQASRGELDLIMMAFPVDHGGLEGVDMFSEPFVLAVPRGHELDVERPADVDELVGRELLLMAEGHCFRDHALEFCSHIDAKESSKIRATSLTTLCLMTQNGIGPTLVPATAVGAEFRGVNNVRLRAFEGAAPGRRIGLRWRSTHPRAESFPQIADVVTSAMLEQELYEGIEIFGAPPDITHL
ncbi:MAG: LysR substrate-binding domain-containing protein [Myxococcota bacterium]